VYVALETYSNVHRGSGHKSMVSTHLYELARDIVLEYFGLKNGKYVVIFGTRRRAEALKSQLEPADYRCVSSQDMGLPLGVWALAVDRRALSDVTSFDTGGGTARLVSPGWVVRAKAPDKFEAGTPAIINVIAFARALQMSRHSEKSAFMHASSENRTAAEILYHDELEHYSGQQLLAELRKTRIGRGVLVPTMEGIRPYINLDNSASTPTFMPVWEAVCKAWRQSDQVLQEIIGETRSICAGFLEAPPADYDVIFTSNTTEAINLVAESLGLGSESGIEPVVLNTFLEHNSNDLPWRTVSGSSPIRIAVDADGFVDLHELEELLRAYNQQSLHQKKRIKLVTVCGASNVLGVCNDLEAISRIAHRYEAHVLVDAAQLAAHRKIEMKRCGIDYLAFSAHKVYAPFGSGVLAVKKGLLRFGPADWELVRRSGEENVGGIAALGKALVLLQRIGMDLIQKEEQVLTGHALRGLAQIPGVKLFGITEQDSTKFAQKGGVIVFELKGMMADRVAKELAERAGIGVRCGCHCAHMLIKRILDIGPMLQRFQGLIVTLFPRVNLPGLVRVSFGLENSTEDIDELIRVLGGIVSHSRLPRTDVKQQIADFVRIAAHKVYAQ